MLSVFLATVRGKEIRKCGGNLQNGRCFERLTKVRIWSWSLSLWKLKNWLRQLHLRNNYKKLHFITVLWVDCSTVLKTLMEKEINTNQGRRWEDSRTSGRKQRRKVMFKTLFQKQSVKIHILSASALQQSNSKRTPEFWASKKPLVLSSEAQSRLKTFNFNQLMIKMHLSIALTSFSLYACYHPKVQ